jgi:hypothetical protein
MEEIVEQATEPVRERLLAWSKLQSPQGISSWELPELIHAVDADFTADRKRSNSPRYTGYWYIEGLRPSACGNPAQDSKEVEHWDRRRSWGPLAWGTPDGRPPPAACMFTLRLGITFGLGPKGSTHPGRMRK